LQAVEAGKQVTAVTELKARFDEANNIAWARQLEAAGIHVVYGLVGKKIHGKVTLVVRKDEDRLRRYLHLATGNYNPNTARVYTDLSLLTTNENFGEDVTNLFNLLTGICRFQTPRSLLIAPWDLQQQMLGRIAREADHAQKKRPARIIAKTNSLSDPETIRALYRASQAGVKIDLIVRGLCCLRPGIPGISENITVRSIVGRFLEHSRIFHFENGGKPETYLGSADWMSRNFHRRVEIVFPVLDPTLRDRIVNQILGAQLADNTKSWILQTDGSYSPIVPAEGQPKRDCQAEFMAQAIGESRPSRKRDKQLRPKPKARMKVKHPAPK
jgi:polyphosphate kinase